jgi:hypothetical protein
MALCRHERGLFLRELRRVAAPRLHLSSGRAVMLARINLKN